MDNVIFEFYIGDTYSRDFTLTGYSETIDEVYFTVKKSDKDKNFILQKTLDNGITLVDDEPRTYNILIDATDTETLNVDTEYPFDIEIVTTKTEGDIKKTIIKGVVLLKEATTRIWNEGE